MSTHQKETSEQLQQMFGALRSLLAEDTHADGWGERLLELSEQAYELDEQVWQEQWASYIRDASRNLPAPLLEVESLEGLEHVATLLPGCLFSLYLGSNEIGDEGARALAQSEHLASLTLLDLGNNEIRDEGARALAQSEHLASLSQLHLYENGIGDEGARALAQSPHLASLTHLDLYDNGIGEEGARALAQSPHLASLTKLDVRANRIGKEGKRALSESVHLSGMELQL